jgi:hypothetical protein
MMMTELIGSLAVVYFAARFAMPGSPTMYSAMAAGLVLAVMMMTFTGAMILPWITIGKMANGDITWQNGALAFAMQMLGAVLAWTINMWSAGMLDHAEHMWAVGTMDVQAGAMTLIGGFLLMIVYDRLSGDGLGNAAIGIFVWMLAAAGLSVVNAGDVGGMLITSGWTGDNMVMIFGSMIIGGVGATAALMFGDMILGEEE